MSNVNSLTWSASFSAPPKSLQPDRLSTLELIAVCQQTVRPDRAMFAELIRRHQSDVERILYHLAPDWRDRHDLARSQTSWAKSWRSRQSGAR